jgi:uncharacterized glyoxalase superfamily protein PhnB
MAHLRRAVPVLPVRDLAAALDLYGRLGFATRLRDDEFSDVVDETYGYAARDDVRLHLVEQRDAAIAAHASCYLFVDDADALAAEWRDAAAAGEVTGPVDTPHGMREGTFTDPDGNVVRFGAPIPTTRQLRVVLTPAD